MTNAELFATIRAKIERRINELDKDKYINIDAKACRVNELSYLKRFLDTLSEEPDKGLEEAAYKYSFESRPSVYGQVDVIDAFIAGAEWQKEQDVEEWIKDREGCFWDGVNEGKKAMYEQMKEEQI
jgi:hypothetical protein